MVAQSDVGLVEICKRAAKDVKELQNECKSVQMVANGGKWLQGNASGCKGLQNTMSLNIVL